MGDELRTIVAGNLHVPEVSYDDLSSSKLPSAKFKCDEGAAWRPFFEAAAKACWPSLKTILQAYTEMAKQKWCQ